MPRPALVLAALPFLFSPQAARAQAPAFGPLPDTICTATGKPIDEKGWVRIGGIEQWVRIKGSSCANPIVVLVHGGPGNPTTPWADNVYKDWEKDFTIVQWDQRGAGMTFARNPMKDEEPLVVEQLRDDGVAVARYAARRFGKHKVILMGGSWSSFLGVTMAKSSPGMFCGYISSSQLVGGPDAQRAGYDAGVQQALLRLHPGAAQGIRAGAARGARSEPDYGRCAVPVAEEDRRLPLISMFRLGGVGAALLIDGLLQQGVQRFQVVIEVIVDADHLGRNPV
jgi:pimeloyl-ACP methyl ester carboxylesterase